MEARLPGFVLDHLARRLEIRDAAGDVGIARGARRAAVILMVHRPHVETERGEFVHQRIIGPARHGKVVARLAAEGRAVHEEEDGPHILADALAVDEEANLALPPPVFGTPDRIRRALGRGRRCLRQRAGAEGQPGSLDEGPARGMAALTYHRVSPADAFPARRY